MTAFRQLDTSRSSEFEPALNTPISLVHGIGTPQCDHWRTRIFARHPWFSKAMAAEYHRIATTENDHVPANRWLTEFEKRLKLGRTGLFVDCQDAEIVSYSDLKPQRIHALITHYATAYGPTMYKRTVERIAEEVCRVGIEFPLDISLEYTRDEAISALARVCDSRWWRRNLRVVAARQLEQVCRELGMVSKHKAPYVSDYTLRRRQDQKCRNRLLLQGLEAENQQTGYTATLAEISDATVSNPVNRRNELMVRMRGYEECAMAAGFEALFFTLTCPSKYHTTSGHGRNPKYSGATPSQAQAYLCKAWARIRAKWDRMDIRCFGFRIAEPHHDGTPHWHLLLFFAPDRVSEAEAIFRHYAMQEDTHEAGAKKYRCEIVRIDPAKGSATGYIAKYVSKNIDGYGVATELDDETGHHIIETARRVEAWASTWGIRQFQQIGSASVTVWRELRRLREPLETAFLGELEQIRLACDAGDWARFVQLLGGPMIERNAAKVRPLHLHPTDKNKAENQYGEICTQLMGVIMRGAKHQITRTYSWRIQRVSADDSEHNDFEAPPGGAPWTCVNNCTPSETSTRQ